MGVTVAVRGIAGVALTAVDRGHEVEGEAGSTATRRTSSASLACMSLAPRASEEVGSNKISETCMRSESNTGTLKCIEQSKLLHSSNFFCAGIVHVVHAQYLNFWSNKK